MSRAKYFRKAFSTRISPRAARVAVKKWHHFSNRSDLRFRKRS